MGPVSVPFAITISPQARLSYLALSSIRHRSLSTSTKARLSSQFHRSDFQGQPFTGEYEPGQPTRGPLGETPLHGAARITPMQLKDHLDQYVVGQERPKKRLSTAIFNHYQRTKELERQEHAELDRMARLKSLRNMKRRQQSECLFFLRPFTSKSF